MQQPSIDTASRAKHRPRALLIGVVALLAARWLVAAAAGQLPADVPWLVVEDLAVALACARCVAVMHDVSSRELAIVHDTKMQLRAEAELRQAQKLEAVGRLAAGIAHEINTPVQFVSDSLHFLRDATADVLDALSTRETEPRDMNIDDLARRIPRAIDRSIDGVGRVANIVRSMKAFAHPDANEPTLVDLNAAIESTLVIARNEYKYVADVVTALEPLPPIRCFVDDINQAVLNVIVNAAHAIGDAIAGSDRRGTIIVRTSCDGSDVMVSISDTGSGIPHAIRDRIFEPFFTTKEVGKGTGQGLAIVHSVIVHAHGGSIDVESLAGAGTTFRLSFPIAGPPAALGAAA